MVRLLATRRAAGRTIRCRERAYHGMHVGGVVGRDRASGLVAAADVEEWRGTTPARCATIERKPRSRRGVLLRACDRRRRGVRAARVPAGARSVKTACCSSPVITGFGTGGEVRRHPLRLDPDLVTCAKGITSGYLPLGAVCGADRLDRSSPRAPGDVRRTPTRATRPSRRRRWRPRWSATTSWRGPLSWRLWPPFARWRSRAGQRGPRGHRVLAAVVGSGACAPTPGWSAG